MIYRSNKIQEFIVASKHGKVLADDFSFADLCMDPSRNQFEGLVVGRDPKSTILDVFAFGLSISKQINVADTIYFIEYDETYYFFNAKSEHDLICQFEEYLKS